MGLGPRAPPDPGRGRVARALNVALVAALFGFSIAVYDRLPERIPVHFDIAGKPDRFEPRSWGVWLLMPVLALAMAGLFGIIGRLVHHLRNQPALLNVPAKAAFLRLTAEAREPVIIFARAMLAWFSLGTTALFFAIQVAGYRVAVGAAVRAGPEMAIAFLGAIVAYLAYAILRMRRMILEAAARTGG